MSAVSYKDLVEYIIKFLVDNPDSIDIKELEGYFSNYKHSHNISEHNWTYTLLNNNL